MLDRPVVNLEVAIEPRAPEPEARFGAALDAVVFERLPEPLFADACEQHGDAQVGELRVLEMP
jgi:hypothetical protein